MQSSSLLIGFNEIFIEKIVTEVIVNVERDAKMSRGIFFTLLFFYLHRREFLYGSLQPEMIAAHGYPEEMHRVITQDGYILHIHRIAATGKQPVLLMHGLLGSSATYTMLGPHKGLGLLNA